MKTFSVFGLTNRGNFYRNTTQSEEPEKPFSTQTDIKRLQGNKKGRTKDVTELMLLPREIPFLSGSGISRRVTTVCECALC